MSDARVGQKTESNAKLRQLIEEAGNIALQKYCYKHPDEPTMLPPIPNSSKFIDKFPAGELTKENLSDQRKQESYEAEVKVYRAFESLRKDLIVLHGLEYTNQHFAEFSPEFRYDVTSPGRVAGECDLLVIGPGLVLIIEVSDVRYDEGRTTNKGVRKAFNQKKKQCERTERLLRAMLRGFDDKETDDPIIQWFFACPSVSRQTIKYKEAEMSRIMFKEDIDAGHEASLTEHFALWWDKNVYHEPVRHSAEKMDYLSKILIGLWIIDPKNIFRTEQMCSLGGNIMETDKLLRHAEITYGFGRKSTAYKNPNFVEADEVFQKMGIRYLSRKQNEIVESKEKFLWINGPAGSGKTVLILGKAIKAVLDGNIKVVIFVNVNEERSKEIYQNVLRDAGIRFKVLDMSMKIESDNVTDVNCMARSQAHALNSFFKESVQIVVFRISNRPSSLSFHIWREVGGLQLIKEILLETVAKQGTAVRVFIDDEQCLLKDESFGRLNEVDELKKITQNSLNCEIWISSDIAQSMYHMAPTDSFNLTKHKQAMEELYFKDQHPIITLEENFRNTYDISCTLSALRRKILWSPDQTTGHFIHGPKPTIHLFPNSSVHEKLAELLKLEVNKLLQDDIMKASDIGFIINNTDSCTGILGKSGIMDMATSPSITNLFDTFSVEWPAVICLIDVTSVDYEANLAPELYLAISRGRVYSSIFMFSSEVEISSEYLINTLDGQANVKLWMRPVEEETISRGRGGGLCSDHDHEAEIFVDLQSVDEAEKAGPCRKDDSVQICISSGVVLGDDKTHVFLSHNWGTDEQGRNNHERVSAVNDALKQLGYKTWFDSDRMTGDIVDTLCDGIDNTRLVLVFVTQKYAKEVQSGQDNDTRKLEFKYAMRRKGATKMIPIIMEERMKNSGDWKGPIGLTLGGILSVKMFFDFDDVDKFKGGMKDLKKEIDNRLKMLQADIPHIPISSLAISAPTPPLSAQRPIQPAIEIPSSSASRVQTTPVRPQPGPATPASQPAPVTPASEAAPVKQSSETILTIPRICNGKITGAYSLDLKELRFK